MAEQPEWLTLDGGESVVWTSKPRVWRILAKVGGALVWSVLAVVGAWTLLTYGPETFGGSVPFPAAVWGLTLLFVAVQAGRVVLAYLRVEATDYVLTDQNVYKKTGVFSETVTRVGIDRIQTTSLRKDVTGNLFDYGTVLLSTAGGRGTDLAITDLDDPETFRDELRPLVDAAAGGPGEKRRGDATGGLDAETVAELIPEARRMCESAERLDGKFDS